VTHIYIKSSSHQRSTTSRVASAAGRLRPNALTGHVEFAQKHLSGNATNRDLATIECTSEQRKDAS
jgi:hypothetical protein